MVGRFRVAAQTYAERPGEHRLVQVRAIYAAASWAILEVTDVFIDEQGLPPWFFPAAIVLLLIGLAVVTATAIVD